MTELNDEEFWVLLSLDSESPLHELLVPIFIHEGGRTTQTRPALDVLHAAEALASLAARGYAEVRLMGDDYDWDRGRVIDQRALDAVVANPLHWSLHTRYWAAATDEGEAAYSRAAPDATVT